jgi:MFS family permease
VIVELRTLLRLRDFRRLFSIRIVSQAGDGMFQVGLAALFFFSPQSQGTAASIAVAFAILLAPFTLVGPWAGVLLDRWRRRQVLVVVNCLRVILTVAIALTILMTGITPAVYVLALVNLSLNRFLLAALGAALPAVVDGPELLTANSLLPTLGAGAAGIGGVIGLLLGLTVPEGDAHDAASLGVAAIFFLGASAIAAGFPADRLGPDAAASDVRMELGHLGQGLADGARFLARRRTPAQALAVMGIHRFFYGVTFVASILISRNLLAGHDDFGLGAFAGILVATAVGFAAAILLTPVCAGRIGPQNWIVLCLALACVSQAVLVVTLTYTSMLICAVTLGLAAQGAKISVDTIIQRDTPDTYRGRAFALYDVLYNSAFIGAAALAAVTLPDEGYSRPMFAVLAVCYAATAIAFGRWGARAARPVRA